MILTTLEIAALIVALEFAVLAWAGPVLLLRRRTRSADAEAEGAATLLADVENKMPSRREALTTIFASTYQLEGDELEAKIEEFVEREQAFYQVMTSVYLDRDPERLKEIPEELTKVISPWIRMTPKNMIDSSSLDELATANSALNAELDETKRSMDELMAEYVAAFNKAEKLAAEQAEPDAEEVAADAALEADPATTADAAAEVDPAANAAAAPVDSTEATAGETSAGEPEADKASPKDPQAVAATDPESDPEPSVAETTAQTKPDEATPAMAEPADEDEFPQADAAVALGDFGDEADRDDAVATADVDDEQTQAAITEDPPAAAGATAPPVIDLDADPDEEPAASAPRTPAAPLSIDLSADPDEELSKDDLDALFADDLGALEEPESASA